MQANNKAKHGADLSLRLYLHYKAARAGGAIFYRSRVLNSCVLINKLGLIER